MTTYTRSDLKEKLEARCTRADIKEIIFDLDLNTDDFPPNIGLKDQIRHLIEYVERRGMLDELVQQIHETCPHVFDSEIEE